MALFFAAVIVAGFAIGDDQLTKEQANSQLAKARLAEDRGQFEQAVKLASEVINNRPEEAFAYYVRGRSQFRLGKVKESVADFDKYIALAPKRKASQWERGIALYYAGKYQQGAKQFELYQTYHDNDVENSVWRYLCQARVEGVKKAKSVMLPIKNDRRPAMMQVYDLYRGKLKVADVLAVLKKDDLSPEQREAAAFYAHLYIGLWYEAAGDVKQAAEHIQKAVKNDRKNRLINRYMWDVARIHAQRMK